MDEFRISPAELAKILRKVYPLPISIYEDLVDKFDCSSYRAEAEVLTMLMLFADTNELEFRPEWGRLAAIPDELMDKFYSTAFVKFIELGAIG